MPKPSDDIIYGRQALRAGEPWIVPGALRYLERIVRPTWDVFEWGAGGSTLWFSRHCSTLVSIEHSKKWKDNIWKRLLGESASNVALQYVPVRKDDHDYADAILKYPDPAFDLVFVDGEATKRDRCLRNSWDKVVRGGYIMLDNSNWWKGDLPPDWHRVDFVETELKWIGVKGTFDWQTSFFRKGEEC